MTIGGHIGNFSGITKKKGKLRYLIRIQSFVSFVKFRSTNVRVLIRDLKQARTATAGNKQLNFTVKNKPHTTNYIYCIFEAYFTIKSV